MSWCNYDKAFNRAIAKFDFDAAFACMDKHKWRWRDMENTPTVDMLIDNVVYLWDMVSKKPGGNMGTGGFVVGIDEDNRVYIIFELCHYEIAD